MKCIDEIRIDDDIKTKDYNVEKILKHHRVT